MHNLHAAKKVLLSIMVLGGLSFFTFASTFAVLNSGTNNQNSVSSGTLTFSNTVGTGTACFSYAAAANSNPGCDALFTSSTLQYPGSTVTAHVTLTNTGTMGGSALAFYMPSCSTVTSPSATYTGGGNMCTASDPRVSISESDATWTSNSCVYPQTSGSCTLVANTLKTLAGTYNSSGHVLVVDQTAHVNAVHRSGLAAGTSRYFIVTMQLPSTTANALQGEEALFNLTWNLSQ